MNFDELMARIAGSNINLDAAVDLANMGTWDVACLIGRTVSLVVNGYEDHYDGVDWEGAAIELRSEARNGEKFTRRTIIKALLEMGYCLEDFIA
jgi:hypothetical protein